ncbi:hypothetical protein LUW87_10160 [Rhabdothermincola sp. EGI L10124]|nr:hypothetical protein [Rhabdothermincola salaria]MCD9624212.1 hypothetical protein [Rhabdothermincola salaria]
MRTDLLSGSEDVGLPGTPTLGNSTDHPGRQLGTFEGELLAGQLKSGDPHRVPGLGEEALVEAVTGHDELSASGGPTCADDGLDNLVDPAGEAAATLWCDQGGRWRQELDGAVQQHDPVDHEQVHIENFRFPSQHDKRFDPPVLSEPGDLVVQLGTKTLGLVVGQVPRMRAGLAAHEECVLLDHHRWEQILDLDDEHTVGADDDHVTLVHTGRVHDLPVGDQTDVVTECPFEDIDREFLAVVHRLPAGSGHLCHAYNSSVQLKATVRKGGDSVAISGHP